jgi:hypothetical protein
MSYCSEKADSELDIARIQITKSKSKKSFITFSNFCLYKLDNKLFHNVGYQKERTSYSENLAIKLRIIWNLNCFLKTKTHLQRCILRKFYIEM